MHASGLFKNQLPFLALSRGIALSLVVGLVLASASWASAQTRGRELVDAPGMTWGAHPTTADPASASDPSLDFSSIAAGGKRAKSSSAGATTGGRAYMRFTPKGKQEVKAENARKHQGENQCENCGVSTVEAKQSKKGVSPPTNETQVDHVVPKAKGGSGTPENGQVLCRDCNNKKSDNL